MKCTKTQLGLFSAIALVALRVCIGWHFFSEGLSHYSDPKWSSEGFLKQAKGPLADWYQKSLPDFHGWSSLLLKPEKDDRAEKLLAEKLAASSGGGAKTGKSTTEKANSDKPKEELDAKAKEDAAQEASYKKLIVHDWVEKASDDWRTLKLKIASHYGFSDEQKKKADDLLMQYRGRLYSAMSEYDEDIRAYRHEGWRLSEMQKPKAASDVPNMKARVEAKQRDLIGEKGTALDSKPPAWLDTAKQVETMLVSELANLADESQQKKGSLPNEKNSLQKQDTFVTYSLLAIGICLMIGLLTPFASLGGVAFLISIAAAQPFWISGTVPTYNQYVEIFALLFLAVSCAGKYAGLDFVLSGLCCGRCCSSKGKST